MTRLLRHVPVLPGCWLQVTMGGAWLCLAGSAGAASLGRWWWLGGLLGAGGLLCLWCWHAWDRRPHWSDWDRMWLEEAGVRLPEPHEHWRGPGT